MRTTTFELEAGLLTEEQQKEFDFIDGKIKRKSPTYPHEYTRWRELREEAKKILFNKMHK